MAYKNPEDKQAYQKKWYEEHKEEQRARAREYQRTHKAQKRAYCQAYAKANGDRIRAYHRAYWADHRAQCRAYGAKYYAKNKETVNASARARRLDKRARDPLLFVIRRAHQRARHKGIPFTITRQDFPEQPPRYCPVFTELELVYGSKGLAVDASASLDRIVPSLGYVPGNVIVVSLMANRIRNNGTVAQHRRIAEFYEHIEPAAVDRVK